MTGRRLRLTEPQPHWVRRFDFHDRSSEYLCALSNESMSEAMNVKWMRPIWRDPVGWARSIATPKSGLFFLFGNTCIAASALGILFVALRLRGLEEPEAQVAGLVAGAVGGLALLLAVVWFPGLLLYAVFRMQKLCSEESEPSPVNELFGKLWRRLLAADTRVRVAFNPGQSASSSD